MEILGQISTEIDNLPSYAPRHTVPITLSALSWRRDEWRS
jgi:hypothetical protein